MASVYRAANINLFGRGGPRNHGYLHTAAKAAALGVRDPFASDAKKFAAEFLRQTFLIYFAEDVPAALGFAGQRVGAAGMGRAWKCQPSSPI